jgi:enoyl-CoA hydratase
MAELVLVEVVDRIQIITINRPEVRNAINLATAEALAAALIELDERSDVTAGILTGAGSTFCAGMDLKSFLVGERPSIPGRGFAGIVERPPMKPLIAAVEGAALAGGFEIALACDLIVAAENAIFGLPEVKRGLVAAGGGLLRLPQRIPFHVAMEWALTGTTVSAAMAKEVSLVTRVTPAGESLNVALELANTIAANGPLAVLATKQIIVQSGDWPAADAFRRQSEFSEPVSSSQDAKEGALAFTEKRPPQWRGL